MTRRRLRGLTALLPLLGLLMLPLQACTKRPKRFPMGPQQDAAVAMEPLEMPLSGQPMSAEELRAAEAACSQWVTTVCECARTHPGLQSKCGLVSGQSDAIRLAVSGLDGPADGGADPEALWQNIRKIERACGRGIAAFKCE